MVAGRHRELVYSAAVDRNLDPLARASAIDFVDEYIVQAVEPVALVESDYIAIGLLAVGIEFAAVLAAQTVVAGVELVVQTDSGAVVGIDSAPRGLVVASVPGE